MKVLMSPEYFDQFASQIPVIGREGQERLRRTRVHLAGLGRVNTSVVFMLAATGVRSFSANDPQVVASDNLGPFLHATRSDLGREKARVLGGSLRRLRSDIEFSGLHAPSEDDEVDHLVAGSDVVVIASNTIASRVAAERRAFHLEKPSISVGVFDGRERLGGTVGLRQEAWHACTACYVQPGRGLERGEGLLYTVVAILAAQVAHLVVQVVTGRAPEANLWVVDASSHQVERMAVEKRPGCSVCDA